MKNHAKHNNITMAQALLFKAEGHHKGVSYRRKMLRRLFGLITQASKGTTKQNELIQLLQTVIVI